MPAFRGDIQVFILLDGYHVVATCFDGGGEGGGRGGGREHYYADVGGEQGREVGGGVAEVDSERLGGDAAGGFEAEEQCGGGEEFVGGGEELGEGWRRLGIISTGAYKGGMLSLVDYLRRCEKI